MKESILKYERKKLYEKNKVKKAVALFKELNRLYKARNNLGWVELKEPYIHGWVKTYVLNIKNNTELSEISFWQQVLKLVNHKQWCANKNFKYKNHKKEWHELRFIPLRLHEKEWLKLEPNKQRLFEKRWFQIYRNGPLIPKYVLIEKYVNLYFKEHVYPRVVTHVRVNNPELESKVYYIHNKLYSEKMWCILDNYKSDRYDDWIISNKTYRFLSAKEQMTYDYNDWIENINNV